MTFNYLVATTDQRMANTSNCSCSTCQLYYLEYKNN